MEANTQGAVKPSRPPTRHSSPAQDDPGYLASVLQQAGDGVVVLDDGGQVVFANAEARRLHGIRPTGREGLPLLGRMLNESWMEEWGRLPTLPPAERTVELPWEIRRDDGTSSFVRGVLSPLRSAEGKHEGTIVTLREDGRRSGDPDAATLQFWEQFTGIMGHDVRTPLTAVRGSAGFLLSSPVAPETVQRNARRILENTDRLLRIFRDLMDFTRSRLEASLSLAPVSLDLAVLTRQVAARVEAAYPERPIQVHCPNRVRGVWDHERLDQLLLCLLENAVLHSPSGSGVVVLVEEGRGDVLLEVQNAAPALSPDVVEKIFDPFHEGREGRRPSRLSGGIGLGLFITRQIVQAHAGTIEVDSSEEAGTRVRVRLPRSTQPNIGATPQRLLARRDKDGKGEAPSASVR